MLQTAQTLASRVFATDRRRDVRSDVLIRTHLMLPGRRLMTIEIGDISEGGMFASLPEPMTERDRARVDLPGFGWINTHVVWAMQTGHGFGFDEPVATHIIDVLRFVYRQTD